MVVVGGIGSVQSLKPLLLFLHKVGVGAGAGGRHSGQPAVSSRLIPWRDRRRRRWNRGRGGDRSWDLGGYRDGGWDGSRYCCCTGAVGAVVVVAGGGMVVVLMVLVVVAVVEGDGRRRLGRSLVLAVVVVVLVVGILGSNGC